MSVSNSPSDEQNQEEKTEPHLLDCIDNEETEPNLLVPIICRLDRLSNEYLAEVQKLGDLAPVEVDAILFVSHRLAEQAVKYDPLAIRRLVETLVDLA